jgi:hypothetical protein
MGPAIRRRGWSLWDNGNDSGADDDADQTSSGRRNTFPVAVVALQAQAATLPADFRGQTRALREVSFRSSDSGFAL